MSIQQKVMQDLKEAMLAKNEAKKSLLRVLIGEFNRKGKELTDGEVVAEIKKMIENAKLMGNDGEIEILSIYLPKQLSVNELENIVKATAQLNNYSSMKDMGSLMKHLSDNYQGRYDGKLASQIVRQCLTN